MEFEQYLERDILAFLESKMQHKSESNIDREEDYGLYLTKDYLKELNYALDNDELTKAKKLFDELKTNYSKLPKKSIERKKIYALLEKMYEKIQDYVKIKEGRIEIIKEGGIEIFKDKTDVFKDITPKKDPTELIIETDLEKDSEPKKSELIIIKDNKKSNEPQFLSEDSLKEGKQKNKEDKININTTKSAIKDNHKGKYYEEKNETHESPEILTQNIFIKTGKNNITAKEDKNIAETEANKKNYSYIPPDSPDIEYLENELIESTIHLEQIKTQIIKKLIANLYQKVDDKNKEQDRKIESIKKDMIESIIVELDNRFKEERKESTRDIEKIKGEILNQAYRQAKNIVASRDTEYDKKNNENKSIHSITSPEKTNIFSTNSTNISSALNTLNEIKIESEIPEILNKLNYDINENNEEDNMLGKKYPESEETKLKTLDNKENTKKMYEQAIYHMNNNNHYTAFELFKELLKNNPKNKAIKIRLHECMEKHPELKNEGYNNADIKKESDIRKVMDNSNKNLDIHTDTINNYKNNFTNNEHNMSNIDNENIYNQQLNSKNNKKLNKDKTEEKNKESNIPSIKLISNSKHREGNKEIHQMYEEAIYTMFQNNYDEAAKIFRNILSLRPDNKAARIRLHECMEVLSHA